MARNGSVFLSYLSSTFCKIIHMNSALSKELKNGIEILVGQIDQNSQNV